MLTVEEIKMFIDEDAASVKKHFARIGERYFDGDHDIKNYRMFYFNSDGQLVEDTSRANVRIPHPFFKELTEQGTQYTLSGSDGFVFSDVPELQSELDARFNNNDDFIDELSETLTDYPRPIRHLQKSEKQDQRWNPLVMVLQMQERKYL